MTATSWTLLVAGGLLSGTPAAAEGDKSFVSLALTATDDVSQTDTSKGEAATTALNLSAAFALGSGIGVGLKYFDFNLDSKFLGMGGTTISGYGPLVSYLHPSGFFANAAYLLSPTKVEKGDSASVTYSDGYGYVLDVGKVFELGKGFGLALQLTQSHVTYKKVKDPAGSTQNLSGTWYDQSLYPYVAAFVFF